MPSLFLSLLTCLLETATKHDATLFAVEHATYTYLHVAHVPDELALEILWDEPVAASSPWQPRRLYGMAAYQFWQVMELAGHQCLDYGAELMPADDRPLDRLTAAARFRKRRELGERGRWAMLNVTDLAGVQDLLATYPSDIKLFSSLLTEINLPELEKLAHQLAQWENNSLEAELAAATQWVQQEQATSLSSLTALVALGRFSWHDGVTVEQLYSSHIRPRQWRAVLAWLPANPAEPIPLQLQFYDARLSSAEYDQTATEAFCRAFGYATLTCRAEHRDWFTATGRQQITEAGASIWMVDAWQLTAFSSTST